MFSYLPYAKGIPNIFIYFNNLPVKQIKKNAIKCAKRDKTHKITTFSSEHSTPNQEHGSISPSISFQFDKALKGSLTTLCLNLNKAKPAPFFATQANNFS